MKVEQNAVDQALIQYLLGKSYYCNKMPLDPTDLVALVHYNDQLNEIVSRLRAESDFVHTHTLNLPQFRDEFQIMDSFFEYLFYAQESFVRKAAYG